MHGQHHAPGRPEREPHGHHDREHERERERQHRAQHQRAAQEHELTVLLVARLHAHREIGRAARDRVQRLQHRGLARRVAREDRRDDAHVELAVLGRVHPDVGQPAARPRDQVVGRTVGLHRDVVEEPGGRDDAVVRTDQRHLGGLALAGQRVQRDDGRRIVHADELLGHVLGVAPEGAHLQVERLAGELERVVERAIDLEIEVAVDVGAEKAERESVDERHRHEREQHRQHDELDGQPGTGHLAAELADQTPAVQPDEHADERERERVADEQPVVVAPEPVEPERHRAERVQRHDQHDEQEPHQEGARQRAPRARHGGAVRPPLDVGTPPPERPDPHDTRSGVGSRLFGGPSGGLARRRQRPDARLAREAPGRAERRLQRQRQRAPVETQRQPGAQGRRGRGVRPDGAARRRRLGIAERDAPEPPEPVERGAERAVVPPGAVVERAHAVVARQLVVDEPVAAGHVEQHRVGAEGAGLGEPDLEHELERHAAVEPGADRVRQLDVGAGVEAPRAGRVPERRLAHVDAAGDGGVRGARAHERDEQGGDQRQRREPPGRRRHGRRTSSAW